METTEYVAQLETMLAGQQKQAEELQQSMDMFVGGGGFGKNLTS